MAQTMFLKFSFLKDKKQVWFYWSKELRTRSDEVLATLHEEGVLVEGCFVSETESACYFLLEANDLQKVQEIYDKSTLPLDMQYKQMIEESLMFNERSKTAYYFHP